MLRSDLTVRNTRLSLWLQISIEVMLAASLMPGPVWSQAVPPEKPQIAEPSAQQNDKQRPEKRQADVKPCSREVTERAFLKNIWCDQKAVWSAPLHSGNHLGIVLPLGGATAAMIATDKSVGRELSEHPAGAGFRAGKDISYAGSAEALIAITGAYYGVARFTRNERMRETALLSFEALADTGIVQGMLKVTTQRERPTQTNGQDRIDDARGKFWAGGGSFPSGHAMSAWALAAVFAARYPDKPAVRYGAYGAAALISASRLTARQHFPSDIVVGAVLGYLIGHYVARVHFR